MAVGQVGSFEYCGFFFFLNKETIASEGLKMEQKESAIKGKHVQGKDKGRENP